MDFLNQSVQQLRELFLSLTPAARIVTGVLLAAIGVSVVYLFQFQPQGGDYYLYGGQEFSEGELAAIETALAESGLSNAQRQGYRIKVPRGKQAEYLQAISKAGATPLSASDWDDPNRNFNPLMTREQMNQQEKSRKQAKISKMLGEIRGLKSVAVEYDETRTGGLRREVIRSAAITAEAEGSRALTNHEIRSIRRTVMMAVGNIESQNIVVIDNNTGISHMGTNDDDLRDPVNNVYAVTKQYYEDYWREKIRERLGSYGPVNVQVNVELDETLDHIEESKKLNDPVVIATDSEKENSETQRKESGGRPGAFSNTGAANGQSTVADLGEVQSKETKNREMSESRVGGTISSVKKAGLVPTRVSVSVGIPESYYRALWQKRNQPAEGEEPTEMTLGDLETLEAVVQPEVQKVIQPLIKLPMTGEDFLEFVTVTTDYEIPEEPVSVPGMSDHAFSWLASNWQTLGLLALGLAGLVFLRGMVKSSGDDSGRDAVETLASAAAANRADDADADSGEPRSKRSFGTDQPSLRDELSELIHDDPDGAASVLKQWIGEAA